ncbi:MAG TPA: N-acyl homoserine lactonase family protein [Actinocatenispora sp.]
MRATLDPDPITRVSVLSTGAQTTRPQVATGTRQPQLLWLLTTRQWAAPVPINVFVIEHSKGLVLFDIGQDLASVTEPGYYPGGLAGALYRRLGYATMGPADTLSAGLATLGYHISEVRTAVLSHLHHDHVGGLRDLRHADIVVNRREWETLNGRSPEMRGLLRKHIDLPGLRWQIITPDQAVDARLAPFTTGYDLFDDGSLVLLPTPGHTPGSLSMLVNRPSRPSLLLVGDLVFHAGQIGRGQVPGVNDKRVTLETTERVRALHRQLPGGLTVLAAHDPAAADLLAHASASPTITRRA